jgi:inhibitor of cysteine peptidase
MKLLHRYSECEEHKLPFNTETNEERFIIKLKQLFLSLLVLTLVLAACGDAARGTEPAASDLPTSGADADRPVSSDDETADNDQGAGPIEGNVIIGEAMVESLDILILESFPVQVNVQVSGYLGDGCTEIGEITTEREEDTFYVHISTVRPADAICIQVLVGFDEVISLDVHGLEAGTYTVDVNGETATFTLDIDNILPEE